MALYFNSNYATAVRVNDGSGTPSPAKIVSNTDTYVRDSDSDYPVGGTQATPYAWYCATAYPTQRYCYTSLEVPNIDDTTYYPNGSFFSEVTAYDPPAPGFADCYAMTLNGSGVWAVARRLYLDYNNGLINSVTVTVTTKGYEPTQYSSGSALTQTYDSSKYMYYVIVYPGDVIDISAIPSAGHYITGGTGTYNISVDNSDITVTITAAPETFTVSGSLYRMYDEFEQEYYYYETIDVRNDYETSTSISSVSGTKIYELDSPIVLNAHTSMTLQARSFTRPSGDADYQVTVTTSKGSFIGTIINDL